MTPKTAAIFAIATLLAATGWAVPAAAAPALDAGCVRLSTGETACGYTQASLCSGFGAGAATGLVDWTLRLTTNGYGTTEFSLGSSPAFAGGGAVDVCTTGTCTWATLYANGQVVADGLGVC